MRTGHITRDARARNDLEIGEFGERRQNIVLHALGEKSILLVRAEIGERKDSNAFLGKNDPGRNSFGRGFR